MLKFVRVLQLGVFDLKSETDSGLFSCLSRISRSLQPSALALAAPRGTMSAGPEPPTEGAGVPVSKASQMLKSCWSCRLISGGGLILSGAYVFNAARKVMRQGGPTSMGTVAQITFAASLAAWGVVIITDPVGKAQRKT